MKLFCLPYAGGSAVIYLRWRKFLDPRIEIIPVELKGRGNRIGCEVYTTFEEAIEDVYSYVKNRLDDSEGGSYAILGHSMGAILAFELAYRIKESSLPLPSHLFISGCKAPQHIGNRKIHDLPDEDFKKEIIQYGYKRIDDFFCNRELVELFIPVLRSDLRMLENYAIPEKKQLLDCRFTVLFGEDDRISIEEITGWKEYTKKGCRIHAVRGGHFYIQNEPETVTKIIRATLFDFH